MEAFSIKITDRGGLSNDWAYMIRVQNGYKFLGNCVNLTNALAIFLSFNA